MLRSKLCGQEDFEQPWFRDGCSLLHEPFNYHRKLWEHCYIVQAFRERSMLRAGRRGLGFGVGREALGAAFASLGARVTLTDLSLDDAQSEGWVATAQHGSKLADLNERLICEPSVFNELAEFEFCDMNALPEHFLGAYDFTWSACVFEHCGSIELGKAFIVNQMECLKPGGVAVHTTEFNISSDDQTLTEGSTVIFRRQDIEAMVNELRAEGHHVDLDLTLGTSLIDGFVDLPPYKQNPHLRLLLAGYITTSIGLIITKAP